MDESHTLTVPSGSDGAAPIQISLVPVAKYEARLIEVATVTHQRAGELLATFNAAWTYCQNVAARLGAERDVAKQEMIRRKAVIILDEAPRVLKEKGVSSSQDTRQALVDIDAKYQELQDRTLQLETALELFKIKSKAFDNAFTSVKRILSEHQAPGPVINDAIEATSVGTEGHGYGGFSGFGQPRR